MGSSPSWAAVLFCCSATNSPILCRKSISLKLSPDSLIRIATSAASSLSPSLDWDAKNPAREQGEQLIKKVLDAKSLEEAKSAASKLKSLSKPFLNWAGKAERLSFDVPTLPLFIHERLSTKAIIETLAGHKTDKQEDMFALFGDPQRSITDQVLKSYEYQDDWTNRMVLGDSLVVMNSQLHYEGLGGQVRKLHIVAVMMCRPGFSIPTTTTFVSMSHKPSSPAPAPGTI